MMCRFIAYLGKKPEILSKVLISPKDSLIQQSRWAYEQTRGVNGDGFGLAWYKSQIDEKPGLFRSVQPAWNDPNLHHLATKIVSNCFLAHVRAASMGSVNLFNCHPFSFNQYSFVHNGTLSGFKKFRRQLQQSLSDNCFEMIQGDTDSEHFFALVMDCLQQQKSPYTLQHWQQAYQQAIAKVHAWQQEFVDDPWIELNSVMTDSQQLLAVRYVAGTNKKPLSLHYAIADRIHGAAIIESPANEAAIHAVLVASEQLTDYHEKWHEVPVGHFFLVDEDYKVTLQEIESAGK